MTVFNVDFALLIFPALLRASLVTIGVTLAAFSVAVVLGLLIAIAKRSRLWILRAPIVGATEFIRSTPLLVQLYILYYVAPQFGILLPAFVSGTIGLGVHYSCYTAEAYRAGLESVPKGQWEAAIALNYSKRLMFNRIILPQAIPPILPILANYMVSMLKDTPILAAITVVELMQRAYIIASQKFLYTEPMTLVGIMFLIISVMASFGIGALQRKVRRGK